MTTKQIPITPLNLYSYIRVDTHSDETLVSVYNCAIEHIDLLILQLQALKAEQSQPDEPTEMTAVLGPKPKPEEWYGKALAKEAAKLTAESKQITHTIINRSAQGFSPKAIAHQVNKGKK